MARYRGPKSKIARKFKEPIFGPDKVLAKKNYPPGMHGNGKRRPKQSEYAIQLQEKQKVKYTYGILEKQFANTYQKAVHAKGVTGEVLLQLIESRLDNVVYRMGLSPTRDGARQLVGHRHITVNGKVVNIASYILRPGDKVGVREKSKSLEIISTSLSTRANKFGWLDWNGQTLEGTFVARPNREEIPENFKEQLIVELYSK